MNRLLKIIVALIFILTIIVSLLFNIKYLIFLLSCLLAVYYFRLDIRKKILYLIIFCVAVIDKGAMLNLFSLSLAGVRVYIIELMYFIIIVHFFYGSLRKKINYRFATEYVYLIFFYILVLISIFKGDEASIENALFATREFFYFFLALIVFCVFRTEDDFKLVVKALYIGVIIYSLQLLSIYLIPGNPLKSYVAQWTAHNYSRIIFRNHEYFLLTLPLSILGFLSATNKNKIVELLILFFSLGFLILGQGRDKLICAIISIVFLIVLILIRKKTLPINLAKLVFFLALSFFSFLLIVLFIFNYKGKSELVYDIKDRILSFQNLAYDDSMRAREGKWHMEKKELSRFLIFGQGMKAYYREITDDGGSKNVFWDNSNTLIIRKVGLLGLIFLYLFIGLILKKLWFCFKNSSVIFFVTVSTALLSIIPGAILRTFSTAYLVQYQIIFIYAVLLGLIQSLYIEVKNEKVVNS